MTWISEVRFYHLDDSQVLLPPQVLLDLRTTGSQAIIQVHQDMDCCIHVCTKEGCELKRKSLILVLSQLSTVL